MIYYIPSPTSGVGQKHGFLGSKLYNVKEFLGKPFYRFYKKKCHKLDDCRALCNYVEWFVKDGQSVDYIKLVDDDLKHRLNQNAQHGNSRAPLNIINMIYFEIPIIDISIRSRKLIFIKFN